MLKSSVMRTSLIFVPAMMFVESIVRSLILNRGLGSVFGPAFFLLYGMGAILGLCGWGIAHILQKAGIISVFIAAAGIWVIEFVLSSSGGFMDGRAFWNAMGSLEIAVSVLAGLLLDRLITQRSGVEHEKG